MIVNGDICSLDDVDAGARASRAPTAVMIGRGAYGRPWLLGQVDALADGPASAARSLARRAICA